MTGQDSSLTELMKICHRGGVDTLADFIFNMMEDERVYWNQFPSEYGKVAMIDKFTARIDAFLDDYEEEWDV